MESAKSTGGGNHAVDPEQAIVLLRALPLLRQLTEESLSRIAAVLKSVHYDPGRPIVQRNSEGEGLYIIWKGEAKVVTPHIEGAAGHTVSTLRCGDYFGLAAPESARQSYKADVFAVNEDYPRPGLTRVLLHMVEQKNVSFHDRLAILAEVTCLLLIHDYADLILAASVWDWSDQPAEGELALVERALQLEKVEADLFRNKFTALVKTPRRIPSIFGGQSIGQALLAASRTIDPGYVVHSLHSYFLRTGKEADPVVYQVHRIRDGMSFATRHVEAIQFGKVIFVMYASFKRPEDTDYYYNSHPMPNAPDPEEIVPDEVHYDNFLMDPRLPLSLKQKYAGIKLQLSPIEQRPCDPADKFQRVKSDPRRQIWMRVRTKLSDDPVLHSSPGAQWCTGLKGLVFSERDNLYEEDKGLPARCVAGYVSDLALLETALLGHPKALRARIQMLSLDHSMCFHRSFKADEWFLYEMESPWTGDGRAFCIGRMYQDGKLVISVSQEGVMRRIEDKIEKSAKL